jgi:hypothetical protein
VKTLRNVTLAAALAVFGIGAALAHGPHGQRGQHGCQAGGEKHEHQKDEKHEHDRR